MHVPESTPKRKWIAGLALAIAIGGLAWVLSRRFGAPEDLLRGERVLTQVDLAPAHSSSVPDSVPLHGGDVVGREQAQGGARNLAVRALTGKGEPVAGVGVVWVGAESEARLGSTGDDGTWSGVQLVAPGDSIEGRKQGFLVARCSLQIESEHQSGHEREHEKSASLECVLVLLPIPTLRGRVERNDGQVPEEGTWVLAFERGTSAPEPLDVHAARMDSEAAAPGAARFVLARTDAEGGFQIDEAPWKEVTLLAGGFGWMSGVPRAHYELPNDGVRLVVRRAFGALLELVDQDGSEVVVSNAYEKGVAGVRWAIPVGGGVSAGERLEASLAGLDPVLASERGNRLLFLHLWDGDASLLGPITYFGWFPGYEQLEARFDARALDIGVLNHRYVLERSADGFCELELRFVGTPAALETLGVGELLHGVLELRDSTGRAHEFPLFPRDFGPLLLSAIPTGEQLLRFRHGGGNHCFPPASEEPLQRTLLPGRNRLDIDLGGMGALEIVPSPERSEQFARGMRITLAREVRTGAGGRAQWSGGFDRRRSGPPFVFAGLAPGELFVRIVGVADGPEPMRVLVEAGKVARIELR